MHLKILLSKIFQNIWKDASFFSQKKNLWEKYQMICFTKLFIVSTKLTIVASYGTRLQWKHFSIHIPSMVHGGCWFTQGIFPYSNFFWLLYPWVTKCIHPFTLHEPSLLIKGIPLQTQSDLNNYGHYFNFGEH